MDLLTYSGKDSSLPRSISLIILLVRISQNQNSGHTTDKYPSDLSQYYSHIRASSRVWEYSHPFGNDTQGFIAV